jgi:hypothetical protein
VKRKKTTPKNKRIELSKFDDALRDYVDMKIALDLDDGVKVNYGKFGDFWVGQKAVTARNNTAIANFF